MSKTTREVVRLTEINPQGPVLPAALSHTWSRGRVSLGGTENRVQGPAFTLHRRGLSFSLEPEQSRCQVRAKELGPILGWCQDPESIAMSTSWLWSQEHVQLPWRPDWACRLSLCQPPLGLQRCAPRQAHTQWPMYFGISLPLGILR